MDAFWKKISRECLPYRRFIMSNAVNGGMLKRKYYGPKIIENDRRIENYRKCYISQKNATEKVL